MCQECNHLCRDRTSRSACGYLDCQTLGLIESEQIVTTDGQPTTGFYWGAIGRRDVASALVCALEADGNGSVGQVEDDRRRMNRGTFRMKPAITFDEDL